MKYLALIPAGIGLLACVVGEIAGERWHPLTTGLAILGMAVLYVMLVQAWRAAR